MEMASVSDGLIIDDTFWTPGVKSGMCFPTEAGLSGSIFLMSKFQGNDSSQSMKETVLNLKF